MRPRAALQLSVGLATTLAALAPQKALAEEDGRGSRFGLLAALGGGMAGVVSPGSLPGFIGFTDLGVELMGEVRPWGGYLRADFLSSGNQGRWTAYAIGAGTQYRLFGNTHRTALFLRGGLTYERWLGDNNGCAVTLVVPNSCNLNSITPPVGGPPPPPPFSATADMLGLSGGVRLELPISSFYLAVGATFVPTVSVDTSHPAGTFQLRFDVTGGFRDARVSKDEPRDDLPTHRRRL